MILPESCEELVIDLVSKTDDEYTYHMRILETLEYCVRNDVSRKRMLGHESGLMSVWMEKSDWPLSIAMCERYFNQKPDDTLLARITELKEEIRCKILENPSTFSL